MTGSIEGDRALAAEETLKTNDSIITKLTQMLCGQCRYLEQTNNARLISKKVEKWWKNHKAEDQRREDQEKIREALERARYSALAKLSPLERQALGLKP